MKPLIYIIDKSRNYRHILSNCLMALGSSNVETFDNPQAALEKWANPDIIILDHETKEDHISGLDFFREYGDSRLKSTRFLFLSSNSSMHIAVSAIRLGAYDYILKSKAGLERLVAQVEKLVKIQVRNYRGKLILKFALYSLGIASVILGAAIYNYLG